MSMADPLLPEPAPASAADEFEEVEHEGDADEDVLPGEADASTDDDPTRPSVLRRPEPGDRLTAAELDEDLTEG